MPTERRATFADIDRLTEIRAAVRENVLTDPRSVTPSDYARFIGQSRVWVSEDAGLITGFSASDERDGTIWALFVDPGQEGRGIGRSLLARACQDLRTCGYARARLGTDPGTRADRLYRCLGWVDTGRDDGGEVIFELDL
jgi:GNAT superfamily N-acetyltransferase